MDIQSRVVNYYKNNQFIQKYLTGVNTKTNEVLLNINGVEKSIPIDVLETIKSEVDLNGYIQGGNIPKVAVNETPEVSNNSVNLENVTVTPVTKEQTMLTDNMDVSKESLNDIKILAELKNKDGLDNMLKKFAINPSTGLIDINLAISKVTRNTMNEVEKAIKNHYAFNEDLMMYDIEGNYTGTPATSYTVEDEMIAKSFNNIKVYIDASKMYPEQVNYTEDQISTFMKTYISKVKEELHGSTGEQNVASTPTDNAPAQNNVVPEVNTNAQANASAGFADIFVLTVILVVYAAIIINLILKL